MAPAPGETTELLRALVAIDSVNPDLVPGAAGESRIAGFVTAWFERHGFAVDRLEATPGRPSIVARKAGTGGGRSLMFNGHLDTTGVADYIGDPFDPRLDGGRVYGRGSGDMKAGVAAMMIAALRATRCGLAGDLLVACVADEENGSLGSIEVAAVYRPDAVIITEPTSLGLVHTHKGFAWYDVIVAGRSAHGSRPDLGIDAIAKAGKVLVAIEAWQQRLAAGRQHPPLGTGSVHASLISGGQEMSSYPASCRIRLERRTIPGETAETVAAELQQMLSEIAAGDSQFNARLERGLAREPLHVSPAEPIVSATLAAAAARLGRPPQLAGMAGWTDCAIFAAKGVPAILFGPDGDGFHAATEWADIASLEATTDILAATARDFCGPTA